MEVKIYEQNVGDFGHTDTKYTCTVLEDMDDTSITYTTMIMCCKNSTVEASTTKIFHYENGIRLESLLNIRRAIITHAESELEFIEQIKSA